MRPELCGEMDGRKSGYPEASGKPSWTINFLSINGRSQALLIDGHEEDEIVLSVIGDQNVIIGESAFVWDSTN